MDGLITDSKCKRPTEATETGTVASMALSTVGSSEYTADAFEEDNDDDDTYAEDFE